MTLPNQRTQATINAREFLHRLMLPPCCGGYAKIPKAVRTEARWLLKHFPQPYELGDEKWWDSNTVEEHYARADRAKHGRN